MAKILTISLYSLMILVLTTFIPNSSQATYSDIMGCEEKCNVASTGYPFAFIIDYPGLTPAGLASLYGLINGWDKLNITNLILSFIFWIIAIAIFIKILTYNKQL